LQICGSILGAKISAKIKIIRMRIATTEGFCFMGFRIIFTGKLKKFVATNN